MKQAGLSLSQETITIPTVGVALAGIMVVHQGDARAEARSHRAGIDATLNGFRAEAREHRAGMDATLDELRAEARADREAFAKQITRLVEQPGTLGGFVQGLGRAIALPGE